MSLHRLLLELSYCGTAYKGWQIQPGEITVQSALEEKLRVLTRSEIEITGCGRTDTGVHASRYYAHFDLDSSSATVPELKSLNAMLPPDIAVHRLFKTSETFHSRFDACFRKYIYKIHLEKNPFAPFNSCWFRETQNFDLTSLNQAAGLLQGISDFRSFAKTGNQLDHYECTLFENKWFELSPGNFEYHIAANRFVRGMVRLIVGMCINFSLQKISKEQILQDLQAGRQIKKSYSVPATGLTLVDVRYPEEKWNLLEAI
ncbi:MAG: tRNA pseudouridine(38-40) synthase TruA [Saprospiraceae bacterium]|nr:tRNA pseudouridine(38-40) synthase TruA [Saprospiraceae bacterium]